MGSSWTFHRKTSVSEKGLANVEIWWRSGGQFARQTPTQLSPVTGPLIVSLRTLKQHYYPEGGWGWLVAVASLLVSIIAHGVQVSLAVLLLHNLAHLPRRDSPSSSTWLVSASSSVSLLLSPVIISVCKRKSTRLVAVVGGQTIIDCNNYL